MSKNQTITIIACIVILGVLGFLGYTILESRYRKNFDAALEKEKEKNVELADKIDTLKNTIATLTGDAGLVEDEDLSSIDESASDTTDEDLQHADSIEEVERRIASFFVHLDQQRYIKEYNFEGSSYNEYEEIIQKISDKTPLLGNETESLYNMFLNMAHFYRVLGNQRISLIKDIIINENDDIESIMRDFYLWYIYDNQGMKKIKGRPALKVLYEYAGFFLNTIGGRNYLMRRESKIRILTSYYSVLILDRANDMKQNPNGIDIRPYLRLLISDLTNKSGFLFHFEYMKNLKRLKEKYNI
ncbi:MAG: hypothetical protein JXL81_00765 [Deltaproteobacteria bacterium]|nr:hypothetical protein [Deltaproteobacteria bacterium]